MSSDHLHRLAKTREGKSEKWDKERAMREQEELRACTFKPKIIQTSAAALRAQVPVEARLHHEADHRLAIRERAKRQLEEQELVMCSFAPHINEAAAHLDLSTYRPLHERVGELQRKKNEKLHELRMRESQNPELSFQPKINPNTSTYIDQSTVGGDITSRLSKSLNASMERRQHRQEEISRKTSADCTFTPRVSATTEKIVSQSEMFTGENRDFLQRQKTYERRSRRLSAVHEAYASENFTFEPQINPASKQLARPQSAGVLDKRRRESDYGRYERLTFRDKERTEALRDAIAQEFYSQFTFQPNINKVSQVIGRPSSIDELVKNERNKKVKQEAKAASEQALNETCTFRPTYTRAPSSPAQPTLNLRDPDSVLKRIEEERRQKELKLEQIRQQLEHDKLKGCTFQPVIKKSAPKPVAGPIVVRGMGRYLELKDLAKRQAEELRQREEKVFFQAPQGNPHHYTEPQPFASHANEALAEARRQRIIREVKEREMQECTFKPATNEASNKELLRRILEDQSF